MNLKRWLCHVVEFDLYLVTFTPNCACLFYYWPVHSMFNRQVRCFFMKLCYNKSICYKQDSQLFTRYAVSASNNLSMKSADSAVKDCKTAFFPKSPKPLHLLEAKKWDLCNMWPNIIPTEAFSNLSLIRFAGKHLEGRKEEGRECKTVSILRI